MKHPSLSNLRRTAPRTLLVIDDSRAIRQMLIGVLRQGKLFDHYLEARDGTEGLEIVASRSVDIVLCDLDMPVLDGFAFLRAFHADPRNDGIPVLMVSASDHRRTRAAGFELGASDYVGKPCDPAELRARVKNYLRLKLFQDELVAMNLELERKNKELAEAHVAKPARPESRRPTPR